MRVPDTSSPDPTPPNRESLRREFESLAGSLVVKIMSDEKLQSLFQVVLKNILSSWAGNNPLKRISAAVAAKVIPRVPPPPDQDTPGVAADLGRLIMYHWMIRAAETEADPQVAAEELTVFIKQFLDNTDFSQWKTMVEAGRESRINQIRAVNKILPDYNGKLLVLLSALPALISIAANGLQNIFDTQLQTMPPDMLFEVGAGVNERIDWKEVGRMLNDYHELIKRTQIGSALSGEGEIPAIQTLTADILSDIVSTLDMKKLVAAGTARARNREAVDNGISRAMSADPKFGKAIFESRTQTLNSRMRSAKNRLQVVADFPNETFGQLLKDVEDNFEALELADLITVCCDIIGRIQETRPRLIPDILKRAALSSDMDSLAREGSTLISEVFEAVKPLTMSWLKPLAPSLINGLCDLLSPDPDKDLDRHHVALQAAIARLGRILGGENNDQ